MLVQASAFSQFRCWFVSGIDSVHDMTWVQDAQPFVHSLVLQFRLDLRSDWSGYWYERLRNIPGFLFISFKVHPGVNENDFVVCVYPVQFLLPTLMSCDTDVFLQTNAVLTCFEHWSWAERLHKHSKVQNLFGSAVFFSTFVALLASVWTSAQTFIIDWSFSLGRFLWPWEL